MNFIVKKSKRFVENKHRPTDMIVILGVILSVYLFNQNQFQYFTVLLNFTTLLYVCKWLKAIKQKGKVCDKFDSFSDLIGKIFRMLLKESFSRCDLLEAFSINM